MAKRKKWGKRPDNAPVNFVHRHDIGINTARTHRDRKKDAKRGAKKHQTAKADQGGFFMPAWRVGKRLSGHAAGN